MDIILEPELQAAVAEAASRRGMSADDLVRATLRERFLPKMLHEPRDEWERLLRSAASPCGVSLSNEALGSEGLYE